MKPQKLTTLILFCSILFSMGNKKAMANINSILFVGDSHAVGDFGDHFHHFLTQISGPTGQVHSYASCGSSPHQWFNSWQTNCWYKERHSIPRRRIEEFSTRVYATPLLTDLLTIHRPQLVVVEMGGNAVSLTQRALNIHVRKFITTIRRSGAKCIWAGPPEADPNGRRRISTNRYGEGLENFYNRLQIAIGTRCDFFDSRPTTIVSHERGGDGIHFGGIVARNWAQALFDFTRDKIEQ